MENLRLHAFDVKNYKTIKHIALGCDITSKKIIQIRGEIGSSKSSLLEGMNIALSGANGIPSTTHLSKGFESEVVLIDGEQKIYLGAKVREVGSGKKKGDLVFETFVYSKDKDGKKTDLIIGGKKATTKDLHKMLTTDITFNMNELFSPNQSVHKKLIEKLFSSDLEKLGVDEILESIAEKKKSRDTARAICEANGSFKETFKDEGYEIEEISSYSFVDIDRIRREITDTEIEKDRAVNKTTKDVELAKSKFENEKQKRLSNIKDKAATVVDKIRELNETREKKNSEAKRIVDTQKSSVQGLKDEKTSLSGIISNSTLLTDKAKESIIKVIDKCYQEKALGIEEIKYEELPVIPILNGVPNIPDSVPEEYKEFIDLRSKYLSEYMTVNSEVMPSIEIKEVDTTPFNRKIEQLKTKIVGAEKNNAILARYNQWKDWITKKGLYEKELNKLAKMYAGVDTGVKGLYIVPEIKSNKVELWLKYDGSYDSKFFGNPNGELRYISGAIGYSESQRGVIGLMLQASRLDAKQQTLRLAILDSIPLHTQGGLEMLARIQKEFNLQIVISRTDDTYNKDNIEDGNIIMENGEAFF